MFSCLRARFFKKTCVTSVMCHSPLDGLERRIVFQIWLCIHQKAVLVCLYLLRRAADHDEASAAVGAHPLEAQVAEGSAHIHGAELLADTVADNLQGTCYGHELAQLAIGRLAEIQVHQLVFEAWCLKLLVVTAQLLDFFRRKPVQEAALEESKGLAVDAFVVERMVSWRDDALHLEGQPAAVAGRVRQELGVVARSAERRYMLAVLMIMGVCRPFVDARHGDGCLQLVQFGRAHGVKLLTTDEGVLRQGKDVVLRHTVGIGLGIEILLQRRWQEIVEPCGLECSLLTDKHEDDVVDHIIAEPARHHADEPFLQVAVPQHLLLLAALHTDGLGKLTDIISASHGIIIMAHGFHRSHGFCSFRADRIVYEHGFGIREIGEIRVRPFLQSA